jgi:GNAT superfamily N-acetyltransferase
MIEPVSPSNLNEVLPLIRLYQEFYQVKNICDDKNKHFFAQFGEKNASGCQFLFRKGEEVLGFATVYFTFTSTIAAKIAVLNDLYTVPSARGQGVATKLIEHCHQFSISKNAARLQWITAQDNTQAQVLYDALPTRKSTWHHYVYIVNENVK